MNSFSRRLCALAAAVACITVASGSYATTSTINPAVPAQNSPLSSATLRSNFQAAYNDITALWAAVASATGISALTGDVTCSGTGSVACTLTNSPSTRSNLGLGTAAAPTFTGAQLTKNVTALPAAQAGTVLQLANTDGTAGRVEVDAWGAPGHFTIVDFGGTAASPTALSGSTTAPVGSFNVWGYNGTAVVGPQAAVRAFASQNWSSGQYGTSLDFAVTPNGSSTLTPAMVVGNDGGVTIGTPTGGDKGPGSVNATGLYLNGTLVSTSTGGSGSGVVNSGVTPDLSYFATSTATVSDASGLQYNATTKGLNLNGVNAHSLPDNGLDTTGVAIGASALLSQTITGAGNVAVGNNAAGTLATGLNNVLIGNGAATASSATNQSIAIGGSAKAGSADVAIGYQALKNEPTDSLGNTAIGYQAMGVGVLTSGNGSNTAIGSGSFKNITSGFNNVGIGNNTGSSVTSGSDNMAIGFDALQFTTGSQNTAIGDASGLSITTGSNNTIIGALVSGGVGLINAPTTGNGNIIIGTDATTGAALGTTTSAIGAGTGVIVGSGDTAFGYQALHATITNNDKNTAMGFQALSSATTGTNNTALGYQAGFAGSAITVGTSNTFVGYQAQANSATASNRTALGNGAISTADNDVVLGNSSVATLHAAVTSITAISDRRLKDDIRPIELGLRFVLALKPVSYRLKASKEMEHLGFIAQDTEDALPTSYRAIVRSKDPQDRLALIEIESDEAGTYNMNYGELLAPMIKAIQEQETEIASLKRQVRQMESVRGIDGR